MEALSLSALQAGNTSHNYEVIPNWAKVPENVTLGYTHGIMESVRLLIQRTDELRPASDSTDLALTLMDS